MVSFDDYQKWKVRRDQENAEATQIVIESAFEKKPDDIAGAITLANDFSKTTGGPTPPWQMAVEYRDLFSKAVERQRSVAILARSPRLTEWLRNPDNAMVARDDLQNLSWWENIAIVPRGIASAPSSFGEGFYGLAGAAAAIPGKNPISDWLLEQGRGSRRAVDAIAGPTGGWFGQMIQGAARSIGLMAPGFIATGMTSDSP